MRFPVLLAAGIALIASVNASALNGKAVTVVGNFLAPVDGIGVKLSIEPYI
jgi:hypothetical protein